MVEELGKRHLIGLIMSTKVHIFSKKLTILKILITSKGQNENKHFTEKKISDKLSRVMNYAIFYEHKLSQKSPEIAKLANVSGCKSFCKLCKHNHIS